MGGSITIFRRAIPYLQGSVGLASAASYPQLALALRTSLTESQLFPGRTAGLTDTFIFSPHVTNEFRFGFSRTLLAFSAPYDTQSVLSTAGLENAAGLDGLPGLSFVNFSGMSALSFSQNVDQVKGITDNFSIFKGNHSLKMGMLFNRSDVFSSPPPSPPIIQLYRGAKRL